MKFEDCSAYEQDMRHKTVELEFQRALFLSRPSVMLELVPFFDGDRWCVMTGEGPAYIQAYGDSPDAAMQAFDTAWKTTIQSDSAREAGSSLVRP